MAQLLVEGGRPLTGELSMPAAKNSILPMMAAALLCETDSCFEQVPALRDVTTSLALLHQLGAKAQWSGGRVRICPAKQYGKAAPQKLVSAMRSSIFYLAPLLVKNHTVTLPKPGGCRLGARPIDLHLSGLAALGASVCEDANFVKCSISRPLVGTNFCLSFPSVGATETLMMAACSAKGTTTLCGCAKEPEIVDLANYLNQCGAQITGAGGSCITVQGGRPLTGCRYTPLPDRITAATVLCAAAACGGRILLENTRSGQLSALLQLLERAGCRVYSTFDTVLLESDGHLRAVSAQAGPYPQLATDAGPLLAAALLKASGQSTVTDTVFEARFACAEQFAKMGAQVWVKGRSLQIAGVRQLEPAHLNAQDLRGGAALVVAALSARGESQIDGVCHIDRGYEDIAALFGALGAKLTRTP
jgi:UDP-N-acetylglucosamine 1-carboxyvinyltransferase